MILKHWRNIVLSGLMFFTSAFRGQAQTVSCAGYPVWSSTTTYSGGIYVVYKNHLYKALVSTTNVAPDYCSACGWWQDLGVCSTGTCTAAPAVPTGLASSNVTSTGCTLSWTAVTTPANCSVTYTVYRGGTSVLTGVTSTSATISGLTANTTYSFTVSAVDAFGSSAQSSALAVKTPATCTAAPSVPTGLTSPSQTSSSVNLSWNAATAGTGCTITYNILQNGSQVASGLTGTSTTISGLAANTTYNFAVAAVDQSGGAQSAAITVTTKPISTTCAAAPSVPTGLVSTSVTSSNIGLKWNASTAGTNCTVSYLVYVNGAVFGSAITGTSATLGGLTANTTYSIAIASSDQAGNSTQSAAISVKTPAVTCASAPAVPTGLASPSQTTTSINLSWNTVTPPANCSVTYDVYQNGTKVSTVPTTTAVISGLAAGTAYSFAIAAVDAFGSSVQSSSISVKTLPTTTAPVTVTFTRKNSYSGGYGGQIDIVNLTGTAYTNWTLAFSTADGLSLYNGTLTQNGSTCTVTPASWAATLGANGTWSSGFSGTVPGTDWHPPATATFNGITVNVAVVDNAASGGGATVATFTDYETVSNPVNQIVLPQGSTAVKLSWMGDTKGPLTVATNYPELLTASLSADGKTLTITSKKTEGGRAGLRLTDTGTGKARYFGIRIKNSSGALPVFPNYVSVGVCSEDTDGDIKMFQDFATGDKNRRADNRYVYLNGGPVNGWYTWTSNPGDRARTYIRNSLKFGLIPTFVWYNIPDGGESYSTDMAHIQDATYMRGYFDLLIKTMAIFNAEAPNETIMLVMEPDCIGYMMQNSGLQPGQITAQVMGPAQASGILKSGDPTFSNTLDGLVKAINYFIKRDCPQVKLGWQINVWSSPDVVPGGNLIKTTDVQGWATGRTFIQSEAQKVAAYYMAAGITSNADFISFDKYGYDAGGADRSPADPSKGNWFWNSDHWNNYLLYVNVLHTQTNLPVALWQLPVGRINTSLAVNPYSADGTFPVLTNTNNSYEDSCATYFFGDRFNPGSTLRQTYFSNNLATDAALMVSGSTLSWGAHFQACKAAGIFNVMFGDGVGDSTRARPASGTVPTDGWWLMTALQRYLTNPVSLK